MSCVFFNVLEKGFTFSLKMAMYELSFRPPSYQPVLICNGVTKVDDLLFSNKYSLHEVEDLSSLEVAY